MSLINVSIQHGRTLDDARVQLDQTVQEVSRKFGSLVRRIEWSDDRNGVKLCGPGIQVDMRVDPQHVHVSGDLPLLGNLLGGKVASGLKSILQKTFPKQLPHETKQ